MNDHSRKRSSWLAAICVLAASAALIACGSEDSSNNLAEAPDYAPALAQAPPELARLYAGGDEILGGGGAEYRRLIESVRGYPIVVNNWASWCGPCRAEFPYFQQAAATHLDEVAFLGVDSEDSVDAAETFLRDNPLPYPSVEAPQKPDFQEWTGEVLVGYPNTLFYDAEGELVHVKQGPYAEQADFDADLQRYALGG